LFPANRTEPVFTRKSAGAFAVSAAVANETFDLARALWVIVKVSVLVEPVPSVTDTSLTETVGNGAAPTGECAAMVGRGNSSSATKIPAVRDTTDRGDRNICLSSLRPGLNPKSEHRVRARDP
jgi:hypothetical protein